MCRDLIPNQFGPRVDALPSVTIRLMSLCFDSHYINCIIPTIKPSLHWRRQNGLSHVRTPKSATFPTLSWGRVATNMEIWRWTCKMNSPPGTTDTPRTSNRLCTSSTSTARQLWKVWCSPKERHSCKTLKATEAEEAETKEAEGEINLLKKGTGNIRNVLIAIRRDIHQRVA